MFIFKLCGPFFLDNHKGVDSKCAIRYSTIVHCAVQAKERMVKCAVAVHAIGTRCRGALSLCM